MWELSGEGRIGATGVIAPGNDQCEMRSAPNPDCFLVTPMRSTAPSTCFADHPIVPARRMTSQLDEHGLVGQGGEVRSRRNAANPVPPLLWERWSGGEVRWGPGGEVYSSCARARSFASVSSAAASASRSFCTTSGRARETKFGLSSILRDRSICP